ncbi:MAG: hypothetical protein PWQ28_806 [Candidatus Woesearchaeota archaeon]|nr:hypothetical protein [Candidatus Woesearchaeota archaeon]MDK2908155.1 hypothetical protein [Candidatus Woesearchaeota archaeon]
MIGQTKNEKHSKIYSAFVREKPADMLIFLNNAKGPMYSSVLAKQADCTYSHVVKVLKQMEKHGLVIFNKKGRLKLLSLTNKGKELAEAFSKVKKILDGE